MTLSVFLFHKDLRLEDNTALIKLIKSFDDKVNQVLPVFIFDPRQVDKKKNEYFSNPAVQFMCESLVDLDSQLKSRLNILHDSTLDALKDLHKHTPFTKIAWNEDWSAFAKKRDAQISKWALSKNIEVITAPDDYYLTEQDQGLGPSGEPYKVLSAFYNWIIKNDPVRHVDKFSFKSSHFAKSLPISKPLSLMKSFYTPMPKLALHGGRDLALKRLSHLSELKHYAKERDYPAKTEGTSRLSPYIKFGCVSIREVYWRGRQELGVESPFLRELVFRDFYAKIYAQSADLQTGERAVKHKLDKNLKWNTPEQQPKLWKAWTTGTTGFPLVDAGMRQLIATGHQHNRVRMLCASVLTKYMWIDWRAGAKFYYTHLVDADIFSNTAGWGFSSGIGIDAAPYYRAPFNPLTQSKKYDPDAEYIKRWVPELASVPAKDIHNWDTLNQNKDVTESLTFYPKPILDRKQVSSAAVARFKVAAAKIK